MSLPHWSLPVSSRIVARAGPSARGQGTGRLGSRVVSDVRLELDAVEGAFAIARLEPGDPVPAWAHDASLCSVTRTAHELSIVCPAANVPEGVRQPRAVQRVRGSRPAGLRRRRRAGRARHAARAAGIPILAISTFDTDLLLVPAAEEVRSRQVLGAAGHSFPRPADGGSLSAIRGERCHRSTSTG